MIRSFPGNYRSRLCKARTWLKTLILVASVFESGKGAEWNVTRTLQETGLASIAAAYPHTVTVRVRTVRMVTGFVAKRAKLSFDSLWIMVLTTGSLSLTKMSLYIHPCCVRLSRSFHPINPLRSERLGVAASFLDSAAVVVMRLVVQLF